MSKNIKIATWNVNSINARLANVEQWLKETNIDILLLQETKCIDEKFPKEVLEDLGYNIVSLGQKTYNGVAIASKAPIEDVVYGLPTFKEDEQARFIQGFTFGINVASVYVPNGSEVDSEKYIYKLKFMNKLREHIINILSIEMDYLIAGDFNVARSIWDTHKGNLEENCILTSPKEIAALHSIINTNLDDIVRLHHPIVDEYNIFQQQKKENKKTEEASLNNHIYSWWDYRRNSWTQNLGFRIDYIFTSPTISDRVCSAYIDVSPRDKEKSSDHTPVVCELLAAQDNSLGAKESAAQGQIIH